MTAPVAREQLRSIVERVERLEEEAKAINEDKADVYREAKANGFDVKVLKRIVQRRRRDASEVEEEDALFALYLAAISGKGDVGTVNATRASTRSDPVPSGPLAAAPMGPEFMRSGT